MAAFGFVGVCACVAVCQIKILLLSVSCPALLCFELTEGRLQTAAWKAVNKLYAGKALLQRKSLKPGTGAVARRPKGRPDRGLPIAFSLRY